MITFYKIILEGIFMKKIILDFSNCIDEIIRVFQVIEEYFATPTRKRIHKKHILILLAFDSKFLINWVCFFLFFEINDKK